MTFFKDVLVENITGMEDRLCAFSEDSPWYSTSTFGLDLAWMALTGCWPEESTDNIFGASPPPTVLTAKSKISWDAGGAKGSATWNREKQRWVRKSHPGLNAIAVYAREDGSYVMYSPLVCGRDKRNNSLPGAERRPIGLTARELYMGKTELDAVTKRSRTISQGLCHDLQMWYHGPELADFHSLLRNMHTATPIKLEDFVRKDIFTATRYPAFSGWNKTATMLPQLPATYRSLIEFAYAYTWIRRRHNEYVDAGLSVDRSPTPVIVFNDNPKLAIPTSTNYWTQLLRT